MKKIISAVLCLMLICGCCAPALAEGIDVRRESVRGNAAFTADSYPTVWITPVFDDHIIARTDPGKYPAKFLTFAPPAGGCLTKYSYDESDFLDHDKLMGYYYFAYDRASFELFLEDAEAANIIKDGSDGVAMFVQPDSRRARAMIDLKPQFGGTAKLSIILIDYSRDITADQLKSMIQAETERVQAEMQLMEPGKFWSEGAFHSVQIAASRDPFSAIVDVTGLTVTRIEDKEVITKVPDGRGTKSIEIAIDGYSYPHSMMEAVEGKLADGTKYLGYNTEYTGYASFTLAEAGQSGPVYLTFKIDSEPSAFPAALEEAYARVAVTEGE